MSGSQLHYAVLALVLLNGGSHAFGQGRNVSFHRVSNIVQLEAAMKAAQPGHVIEMANGEWRDVVINFNAKATFQKPVTLRAKIPGQVFLTGKSKLRLNSPYLHVDGLVFRDGMSEEGYPVIDFRSHDGEVRNTAIVNFNPADGRIGYQWVVFSGSNNRIDRGYFVGKNNRRPVIANGCCESRQNKVMRSYFKDIAYVPENGREIIQVQGVGRSDQYNSDGAFFLIENNLFDRADGEGAEIISIKSNFNIIRYNTIRASRGGITLRSGYSTTVEANYIFGAGRAGTNGIRVQGHNHKVTNNYIEGVANGLQLHTGEELFTRGCITDYLTVDFLPLKREEAPCGYVARYGQVSSSTFAHNTFVNVSGVDIFVGINYKSGWPQQQMVRIPEDNSFANNLIYKPAGGSAVKTQMPDGSPPINTLVFKPNNFFGNLVFGGELDIAAPSSDESGFVFADPLLTKVDGVYRPSEKSPVVNKGFEDRRRTFADRDVEGQRRDRPDIGADELSRDRVDHPPLTPEDVGPDWMKPPKKKK